MKLLELALNPKKANLRFSPFTTELPPGYARKLEYYFGDRASVEPGERALYSRDASTPPFLMNLLIKRGAWAVVRPQVRGELFELIKYANENFVPIVPRGAGTSGYGGAVPTEGGIVVDLRSFNKVIRLDKAAKTVTVEGNITFWELERALRKEGLALRQYPTSAYAATVAGWVAQGGGGVGSLKYGPFRNDVVSCLVVRPDGKVQTFGESDLDLVSDTHGTAGFIIEVTLKVREAGEETPFLASFDELGQAALAARRCAVEAGAWSLHFHTPDYAEMVNAAASAKILPHGKHSFMVVLENSDDATAIEKVKGIVTSSGGKLEDDAKARVAWDARFNHLNLKRLGPSVVVSEAIVDVHKLGEGVEKALSAVKAEKQCVWAIAISPRDMDLVYYALDDERRPEYPTALGNSLAFIDAAKSIGGSAYSTGVLGSNESETLLNGGPKSMKDRLLEPARGAAITLGALIGGGLVWALMAVLALLYGPTLGAYGPATAALAALWANVTGTAGAATLASAALRGLLVGVIVGFILLGPLVFNVFQRGEPLLNVVSAALFGGGVFVLLHLVGVIYLEGVISVPAVVIGLLSGALGTLWALPAGLAGAVLLRNRQGRLGRLEAYRKETDPREVFNPGPVIGARTRPTPLPVHDFPLQLNLSAPVLKSQRGWFKWSGGEKSDPSFTALNRAIGRSHAGGLSDYSYEVTTCIFCGFCNAVAPEAPGAVLESQLPRGRVQLAKAVLEGAAPLTEPLHRNLARTPLAHAPDAICPVLIPIARVTDLLLAAAADQFGALPEHQPLVENVEKEGNVLGKPNASRSKWAAIAWDTEARTLFFGDDAGSFEAPETLFAAARAITNAGVRLNYLGPAEKTSGATLYECGLRETAKPVVAEMLDHCDKRKIDVVMSPDANCVRAVKLDWPDVAEAEEIPVPHVLHTTEALAQYLKSKKLEFESKWEKKVVYHAPEALQPEAREAGAKVLEALGATVLPRPHRECGHGRALDLAFPDLQREIAETAIKDALDAGAEAVVTASPGCYTLLKNTAKKAKVELEVVDLHVVVSEHMKVHEAAGAAAAAAPAFEEPEEEAEPEIPPGHYRVEFVKEKKVLAVSEDTNILDAGEEAGLELPSSCKAGSCDTCCARWEGTAPDQSAAEAISPDQQKTYVLTCIARPKGPIKIWSEEKP